MVSFYGDPFVKLTVSIIMMSLILMALFVSSVKSDMQRNISLKSRETLKNWSFEERDHGPPYPCDGVYECPPWESNNGGWRELRGDVDGNGICNIIDLSTIARAYGSYPGHPKWNPDADLNGDGVVNTIDTSTAAIDFGKTANSVDGYYSWYTNGGGEYTMWQWLDSDVVKALAGETGWFSFYFYPESVAPDGSQNNARAEIYYAYSGGDNTVYGGWVAPTSLDWWYASVIVLQFPSTTFAVAVIIHGTPQFKAWVDHAKVTAPYYRTPPYENQGTDPENGYCRQWMNAMICVYANKSTGQASAYSWDASGTGVGKLAYAQFNKDPPTGNSPGLYVEEGDGFSVGAYWAAYGYLGAAVSSVGIELYLYKFRLPYGWEHVKTYTYHITSIEYPNQAIFFQGSVSFWIPSPPSGAGSYSLAARAYTYAAGDGGSAVANFLFFDYFMYIDLIKISS